MAAQHVDVIIIGAGLSGIGMACHLTRNNPNKTYLILEGRDAIGGTWDLFRYPGIRSDSDMFTLGYSFKPWKDDQSIADGHTIRAYINEAADEYGVREHIRFGHHVEHANWSSSDARWYLTTTDKESGKQKTFSCNFLVGCTGYYRYDAGYTPEFPGRENFKGEFIHPQLWPEDLDYSNKKIVIIGSGATAVTLLPSLADKAQHVTMLQRSPSYVASVPKKDNISIQLRKVLPEKAVYHLARTRNVALQMAVYNLSKVQPKLMRHLLQKQVQLQVGEHVDMKHFTPTYNPWDERLCAVPNGDLFRTLREGKGSVVTDHIEAFTETGIQLKSGEHLEADIIISATGLELQLLGNAQLSVDDQPYDISKAIAYRSLMFSNLPNVAMIFGYTNSSWTLKADIGAEYICRILTNMERRGMRQVMPVLKDTNIKTRPFLDFSAGYVQRALDAFPKQGTKAPWKVKQNYLFDFIMLKLSKLDDGILQFSHPIKKKKGVFRSRRTAAL
ncbi:MAG TPA: NAD(P)/FAD-dependent oxidoreductase [Alcanivoracaceae bacterium]|nr:NAD(P)/FAD-dependent oxidoreductase [Alcanivoracaceae bacterium]